MEKQVKDNQLFSKNFAYFIRIHYHLKRLAICSTIVCVAFYLIIIANNAGSFIDVGNNGFLKELLYGDLYDNLESNLFVFIIISICGYAFPKMTLLELEAVEHSSTHANRPKFGISTIIKVFLTISLIYVVFLLAANYCLYYFKF